MIISTGMADEAEIQEAVDAARTAGCKQLVLLHCVSGYPASSDEYNLRTIPDMQARYGTLVGLSDHTLDNATAIASVAMGACVIEKHFTLDRKGGGPDDSFSLEPADLVALCRDARIAWEAMGSVNYGRKASERANVQFRRSLYVVRDVAAGEVFTSDNVKSIRPGMGLAPKLIDQVLGKRASGAVERGTPLAWDLVDL